MGRLICGLSLSLGCVRNSVVHGYDLLTSYLHTILGRLDVQRRTIIVLPFVRKGYVKNRGRTNSKTIKISLQSILINTIPAMAMIPEPSR